VAVSSGTAALHAACLAAGIGPGDEVIVSPMTFAASANCVLYCGGTPVFADIDPYTWSLSPFQVEKHITSQTKAVITVDYMGQASALHELRHICRDHQLWLIEDAAHAMGTRYDGRMVGSIADMTTFSFHPVKTVTAGEGGAVTTNDPILYDKVCQYRAHGITRDTEKQCDMGGWYYEQQCLGFNYRLSDIHAALCCSQLKKLDVFSQRRKDIEKLYDRAFAHMPEMILPVKDPLSDTTRHIYVIRLNTQALRADRKAIFNALRAENIGVNVHYIPVYRLPYYRQLGYLKGLCPHAEALYDTCLTLPLYYAMSNEDVGDVIKAVKKVMWRYRR
jgi:dTDP-4-amino-4,6-dideoxygalactose transaminase